MNTITMINVEKSCQAIKEISVAKGFTIKRLQKALGLESVQTIYHWFSGCSIPSIDNLFTLAHVLNVQVEQLIVTEEIEVEEERDWL